jgi:hypothetical protein
MHTHEHRPEERTVSLTILAGLALVKSSEGVLEWCAPPPREMTLSGSVPLVMRLSMPLTPSMSVSDSDVRRT